MAGNVGFDRGPEESSVFSLFPLISPSKRRPADLRRSLHYHEARALQVLHKNLCNDLGHYLICVMDPLAAGKAERIGECIGKVGRVGGGQVVDVGHGRSLAARGERSKNDLHLRARRLEPQKSPAPGGWDAGPNLKVRSWLTYPRDGLVTVAPSCATGM